MLSYMNVGGTEKAFLNLVNTLSPEKYEVTLFLLENRGRYMDFIPDWIDVKFMKDYEEYKALIMEPPLQIVLKKLKNKNFYTAMGLFLFHIIAKLTGDRTGYYRFVLRNYEALQEKYDVAIAYAGPMDFITVFVLDKVHAKEKIQWIHFDVLQCGFTKELAKRLYPKFNHVYVVSDHAREVLVGEIPTIDHITETRHNIVSKEQCLKEALIGETFSDNFEGIRILTVGRLSKEKGQNIIPEIAKKLKDDGYRFRWYLIGTGNLETELRTKIAEYKLEKDVILLGLQINPYAFYRDCDLYVQTSIHEGYCITIAEALAFDKYVISTDVAGAKDQIVDGINGVVCKKEEIIENIEERMRELV